MGKAAEGESHADAGGRLVSRGYKVLDEQRHTVNYGLSVWGDYFIQNPTLPHTHENSLEWMTQRRDELILESSVKLNSLCDPVAEMNMIDALQRLGVSYHFKEEIDLKLQKLSTEKLKRENLHDISLQFRLLRQDRFYMSSDVFKSFMDEQANFTDIHKTDIRAMLALYEASHLATPDEQFLKDAQKQTMSLLESMVEHLEKKIAGKVKHALETPSFRRMKRLEARLYIPLYEEDKEECCQMILELAKLDFYLLQRLHREEVREISEWYYGLESPRKLYYARHRPVESYFWALGVYFEPQFAKARMLLAKYVATITPYDDTIDNYGVWEELQPFADVMQRWDADDAEQLGECYKDYARFMFGTMKEIENALPKDTSTKNVIFIKDMTNQVCKGYMTEIVWRDSNYIPSLEEHLKVTTITSFYWAMTCVSFIVTEERVTNDILEWMSMFPQVIKDSCIICRVMADIVAHQLETERNNVATAVTCYMKENGTTEDVATKALSDIVENAWISMNKEYLTMNSIPSSLYMHAINLARMMDTMYKGNDAYTDSAMLKKQIAMLVDKPLTF